MEKILPKMRRVGEPQIWGDNPGGGASNIPARLPRHIATGNTVLAHDNIFLVLLIYLPSCLNQEQRSDLYRLQVKLPPVTTSLTTQR